VDAERIVRNRAGETRGSGEDDRKRVTQSGARPRDGSRDGSRDCGLDRCDIGPGVPAVRAGIFVTAGGLKLETAQEVGIAAGKVDVRQEAGV